MCTKLTAWKWFVALWGGREREREREREKITPKPGTALSEVKMLDVVENSLFSFTPQLFLEPMSLS